MLDDRKLSVLRAIVEDYVRTHEPVGSKNLVERHSLGVSPVPPNTPNVRVDEPDRVYITAGAKNEGIVDHITEVHATGQPILVGTQDVAESEDLHAQLLRRGVPAVVLNAKNDEEEARVIAEAGKLGAREIDEESGLEAVTEVKVISRNDDGTSLLEIRPLTGRTNQIRIHLWQAGFPIVGDPVYLAKGTRGDCQTMALGDPAMCLHAWKISFNHPHSGERVSYEASVPAWAEGSLVLADV